ncbi:phage GP46 family protein [Gluconacetobacter azotocaptans]|uniref:phage GP46 family protein n=1 Tax=Gluconacetobacter azotocaptans TaxID=142834 RepID=UPI00195A4304|nr:phage GP46 family protein [Gluconacetobacter azotocaptans]MBM9401540.1 phage GP46 family protein [Gluconacetobacter azotocaptans]
MDVAIIWNPGTLRGDWSIVNGDLALGDALESAVLISIFSDGLLPQQPTPADVTVGITEPSGTPGTADADRGGWWGDAFSDVPIGSRLRQLKRAIKSGTAAIPLEVQAIVAEALQWMIDDGIAASVNVAARWAAGSATTVEFTVTITEPGATTPRTFTYSWAWKELT